MKILDVTIPGQPVGKGRPKFVRATGRAYTPKGTAEWERSAAYLFRSEYDGAPVDGALSVTIIAVMQRPKRLMRKKDPEDRIPCLTKPDIDNVVKSALDALVMGGVIRDDKTVWKVSSEKLFTSKTEGPCLRVVVET